MDTDFWQEWPQCDGCELPAVLVNEWDVGVFLHLCWKCGIDDLVVSHPDGEASIIKKVAWIERDA